MKVADLFAGVGGMSLGFLMANFEIEFAIEYDEKIANSYIKNHRETEMYIQDVSDINIEELHAKYKKIDIIVGGPPCQGFSQKGKRLSLDDERNFMYKRYIDFIAEFMPKYFLIENVPNIISAAGGYFKDEIINSFKELGYSIDYKVLNAADYGVPQNRKRAFFLGKKGTIALELPKSLEHKVTIKDAIYDLPFIASGEGEPFFDYEKKPISSYQKIMRKNSKGIYNHISTNHSKIALERLALIPKGKGREVLPPEHRTGSVFSGTWTRLKEDGRAATITTRFDTPSSGLFTHPILNRCLTVREAARIQSFPDSFIFYGNKTTQMKQVGNAVPPLLAKQIALTILNDNK